MLVSRLYRNRRRLAVAIALSLLAGFLMYARHPGIAYGLPLAWTTAALYAAFVGAAALLVCLCLPAIRFSIELFALSRLLFATLVCAFPAQGLAVATDPMLNATAVVSGGALLGVVLFSRRANRLSPSRPGARSVQVVTHLDILSAWQALLSTPPDVAALGYDPRPPGPARCLHQVMGQAPDFGDLTAAAAAARGEAFSVDGTRHIRIEDLGSARRVTLTVQHQALAWPTRIALWLDDAEARTCDIALRARPYRGSMSPVARMA